MFNIGRVPQSQVLRSGLFPFRVQLRIMFEILLYGLRLYSGFKGKMMWSKIFEMIVCILLFALFVLGYVLYLLVSARFFYVSMIFDNA